MKHYNKLFYIQEAIVENWNCETCKYSETGKIYIYKCNYPKRIKIENSKGVSHDKEI